MPFKLHVWYKKYVYRLPNAGEPGHGPFPTVYDKVVSRRGMRAFCEKHDLEVLGEYGTNFYLKRFGALRIPTAAALKVIELLSFGKLKSDHNNLVYILRKPG
jgi:hypothetical protein